MTKLNSGSTLATIYHRSSTACSQREGAREWKERGREWKRGRKVTRIAEAWIMEWGWCVYSRRSQNYSHFAAFNQWFSLYILNPLSSPPSLTPSVAVLIFTGSSFVSPYAVIWCTQTERHKLKFWGRSGRVNNTSSSKSDGWVAASSKSLYITHSPPFHSNLCPSRQDHLLCGLIILTWSILWLFVPLFWWFCFVKVSDRCQTWTKRVVTSNFLSWKQYYTLKDH